MPRSKFFYGWTLAWCLLVWSPIGALASDESTWTVLGDLAFGEQQLDVVGYRTLTVHNLGPDGFLVEPVLSGDTTGFAIISGGTSRMVMPGEDHAIVLRFEASELRAYGCQLDLGDTVPAEPVSGSGRESIVAWEIVGNLDFGDILVGESAMLRIGLVNTGEAALSVEPALIGNTIGFRMSYGAPGILQPGSRRTILIYFEPLNPGSYACEFRFSPVVPLLPVTGSAHYPRYDWTIEGDFAFGPQSAGVTVSKSVIIRNTGELPLTVVPEFVPAAPGFSARDAGATIYIAVGGSTTVIVDYLPVEGETVVGNLSLGLQIPAMLVTGTGGPGVYGWYFSGDFNFVETVVGTAPTRIMSMVNTGGLTIDVRASLATADSNGFAMTSPLGWVTVPVGGQQDFQVTFTPEVAGTFMNEVVYESPNVILSNALVSGTARIGDVNWSVPGSWDLGSTTANQILTSSITIANLGETPLAGVATLPDTCAGFSLLYGPYDFVLQPGAQQVIQAAFSGAVLDTFHCLLDLGTTLPSVPMTAVVRAPEMTLSPSVESLAFGTIKVGESLELTCTVINTSPDADFVIASIEPSGAGFLLTRGGESALLLPGHHRQFSIKFLPAWDGDFSANLLVNEGLVSIPLNGSATPLVPICNVVPPTIDFGVIPAGDVAIQEFVVTNDSEVPVYVAPRPNLTAFLVSGPDLTLLPGQSQAYTMIFTPREPDNYVDEVPLGTAYCGPLVTTGQADLHRGTRADALGVFFDPGYTTFDDVLVPGAGQTYGYLVLTNASSSSGVGAWECAPKVVGPAAFTGWILQGDALNSGTAAELVVGLLGAPLPWASDMLLAEFEMLTFGVQGDSVQIRLEPTIVPSIPGQMSYQALNPTPELRVLTTITGVAAVATLQLDQVSNVELPAPLPTLTQLLGNVPNPFNPSTEIRFLLADPGWVRVAVYDLTGHLVGVVAEGELSAGTHSRTWSGVDQQGRRLASGVYYVRLETASVTDTHKVLMLK